MDGIGPQGAGGHFRQFHLEGGVVQFQRMENRRNFIGKRDGCRLAGFVQPGAQVQMSAFQFLKFFPDALARLLQGRGVGNQSFQAESRHRIQRKPVEIHYFPSGSIQINMIANNRPEYLLIPECTCP